MKCLNYTLFFLVFLALLIIDAQARVIPEISLTNDLINIVNIAGRTSSQLPPSSTISSPQPIKEIRRRSSSIYQIIFDTIGWDLIGNLPPIASSPAEQQVEKTSRGDDEIASIPRNNLIPSTSSILYPSPTPGEVPSGPKLRKRSPPPAPPSSSSSTSPSRIGRIISPCQTGSTPWPCSRLKSMAINDYEKHLSLSTASPKAAPPTGPPHLTPHTPPIRPSSSSKNEQLDDQMINGINSSTVIYIITDSENDPQVS